MSKELELPAFLKTDDGFVAWLKDCGGVAAASHEETCRTILRTASVPVTKANIAHVMAMIERLRDSKRVFADYSMFMGKYDVHCATVPPPKDIGPIWDEPIAKVIIPAPARTTTSRARMRVGLGAFVLLVRFLIV